MSIIFITHKLNEVLEDREPHHRAQASGRKIETVDPREPPRPVSPGSWLGREVLFRVEKACRDPGEVALEVEGHSGGRRPRRGDRPR
jgi:ABC-type uncharacterized transport system ATPase subunit